MITVVSGLPRSGTSMMMQMLGAGGLELYTDGVRQPDDDNPNGYFEHEMVKHLEANDGWVGSAEGKAIKVTSPHVLSLPLDREYRVIFMMRPIEEVVVSQREMLDHRGEVPPSFDAMREIWHRHVFEVLCSLKSDWEHFEVLEVRYRNVIDNPLEQAELVERFLELELDTDAMAAVVDPNLYRNRL